MPAAAPDARHVAWYSETFALRGLVKIREGRAIVGLRDAKPFIHCHGIWETADGRRYMGHMLGPDCIVAEQTEVTAIGFRNATFEGVTDSETNFTLFEPINIRSRVEKSDTTALLVKVRPNQDICLAIEEICREHGIETAQIFGIGSLYEVHFADGRYVASHATEVMIREGDVTSTGGQPRARLDIAVVDIKGAIHAGEIMRGDNPVCITFELIVKLIAP